MKIPKIGQTLKTPRAVIDKVAYMSRASLKKVFEGYHIPRIMFSKGIPHLMFFICLRTLHYSRPLSRGSKGKAGRRLILFDAAYAKRWVLGRGIQDFV